MAFHSRSLRHQMSNSRASLNHMQRSRRFTPEPRTTADRQPQTARSLLIIQTYTVQAIPGTPQADFFEIWCAPDDAPDVNVLKVLTRNADLYADAVKAEGTDARFHVTYHASKRPDGSMCRVLDSLERI